MRLIERPVWLYRGELLEDAPQGLLENVRGQRLAKPLTPEEGQRGTMAYGILHEHSVTKEGPLKIKFDSMISHDLTFVGIIQTARASGLKEFPLPYVLTNCHNSLCAVGGTINRDDHTFGMSACVKYGGIYVPANQSIIHSYAREALSGCGRMVLGSDSHTRYGALGTMGVGEGGGELVKQLLKKTYDINMPKVVAVYVHGAPRHGVGPQDVALALVKATFASGFVKNKVLEFVGPGIENLSMDFRNGVDVMTTETTCLSSIWCTDEKTRKYFEIHGRPEAYRRMEPAEAAWYDSAIDLDLDEIEPMIALPFHPSNGYTIRELNENLMDILALTEQKAQKQIDDPTLHLDLRGKVRDGKLRVDEAEIAGCSGGSFENLVSAARIMKGRSVPNEFFSMSVYPASNPVLMELVRTGVVSDLLSAGVLLKSCFCGPCFGAGDVPANGSLAIRHTTRNFPNREGSKPKEKQMASVALMDARSIAATAANNGYLTSAADVEYDDNEPEYHFDDSSYRKTIYQGFGHAKPDAELHFGPNIKDWPPMIGLTDNALLKVCSVIGDPVTTTDELIPSGDASSYRSNPMRMAEFTLSKRDPGYVPSAKQVQALEKARQQRENDPELQALADNVARLTSTYANGREMLEHTLLGSLVYAVRPGDGSAREQAASCQRVLGGVANICKEYATKRYRSNLVNWGIIPFTADPEMLNQLQREDYLYLPNIRKALEEGKKEITALRIRDGETSPLTLYLSDLTPDEAQIILAGSLINYYAEE